MIVDLKSIKISKCSISEFAKEFFLGIKSFVNKTGNDALVEVNLALYFKKILKQGVNMYPITRSGSFEKKILSESRKQNPTIKKESNRSES